MKVSTKYKVVFHLYLHYMLDLLDICFEMNSEKCVLRNRGE